MGKTLFQISHPVSILEPGCEALLKLVEQFFFIRTGFRNDSHHGGFP
jgi:hypothetical protein